MVDANINELIEGKEAPTSVPSTPHEKAPPAPGVFQVNIRLNPSLLEVFAAQAYEAYTKAVGGIAFNGDTLPSWPDVAPHIKAAWRAAIVAVFTKRINL